MASVDLGRLSVGLGPAPASSWSCDSGSLTSVDISLSRCCWRCAGVICGTRYQDRPPAPLRNYCANEKAPPLSQHVQHFFVECLWFLSLLRWIPRFLYNVCSPFFISPSYWSTHLHCCNRSRSQDQHPFEQDKRVSPWSHQPCIAQTRSKTGLL